MPFTENRKVILCCGCLALFFPGAFVFGFPGVMASQWQVLFDVNKAQVGQVMFFIIAATGCSMLIAGRLQEKIAHHKIMFTGSVACGLGMIFAGQVTSMGQVYAWAFWEGFFAAFVYIPCMTLFQKMFPDKKGLASGVLNLTFGGAAAVMSPVFAFFLVSRGYPSSAWAGALLCLVFGSSAAWLIRLPKAFDSHDKTKKNILSVRQVIQNPSFRCLWLIWAFSGAAGVSLIILAASFGESLGYPVTGYVYILICFNLFNGAGRLLCGRLADTYSKQHILAGTSLLACAAYGVMAFCVSLPLLCLAACFVGLAFGALFTVSAPLVTQVFGLDNFGRVFGLVFTAYGFVAGILGPWLSGVILDMAALNFTAVFLLFAAYYLLSSILILQVKH